MGWCSQTVTRAQTWRLHSPAGGEAALSRSVSAPQNIRGRRIDDNSSRPWNCWKTKHGKSNSEIRLLAYQKMSRCLVVAAFGGESAVVSLPAQLALVSAWFSEIYTDCWTCIMHECVHMHLDHHVCPCRNASTNGTQSHFALFQPLPCARSPTENNLQQSLSYVKVSSGNAIIKTIKC